MGEVCSAPRRRKREETRARGAVEQQFRSEMGESLTSVLLSCELAISVPGVSGPAAQKIRAVDDLAREMSLRLGANWRLLTMAASACPEKVAPSIHNGEIAAQKVFPA